MAITQNLDSHITGASTESIIPISSSGWRYDSTVGYEFLMQNHESPINQGIEGQELMI